MTSRTPVGPDDIENTRRMFKLTQPEMAEAMNIPLRTYEDLVASRVNWRPVHRAAAEMALMKLAKVKNDPAILPAHLQELVTELFGLIGNEKPAS